MAATPTDTARVVVQPRRWTSDGTANIAAAHDLDFRRLDDLRGNRRQRGFGRGGR